MKTMTRPRVDRERKARAKRAAQARPRKVLRHIYQPRGGCKEVFEAREEEVLVSGPAGTGKSRACLEKLLAMCLLTANTRGLILRKTLRSLGSSALVTWRNYVAKEALATGQCVYYGGSSQEAPQYRFKNGSTVTIGGLDNPTRIMSTEYDIVYVQEATEITVEDLEMITTRLRNWQISFQQLIMDCNPAGDKHWLKLRCGDGKTRPIESRHEDNPRLFDEVTNETGVEYKVTKYGAKYIQILDNLTGVRYKRLRLGLWVSAEGIVYEEFDPAYHVLDWEYQFDDEGKEINRSIMDGWEEWDRYWVIDFGFTNPFVLKCFAIDPEGAHYLYREIYMTERTVAEHATTIMDIVAPLTVARKAYYNHLTREHIPALIERKWIEPEPVAIICDHDAEGRRTFENETGLSTIPAFKNVYEGINAHKQRIKDDKYFIMADALVERDKRLAEKLLPVCTVDEYAAYVWKVSADGRIKDEPEKKDDHGMDTDRYHTAFHDLKGKARYSEVGV
jgi:phage terminase large subunit